MALSKFGRVFSMINAPLRFPRTLLARWLLFTASCGLFLHSSASLALAAGTVLSTGFESPFLLAPLEGQFGWLAAGSGGSTADVQNTVAKSGSQAVTVTKAAAANTDRRWAMPVTGYPSQRYIIVDWDMRGDPDDRSGGLWSLLWC